MHNYRRGRSPRTSEKITDGHPRISPNRMGHERSARVPLGRISKASRDEFQRVLSHGTLDTRENARNVTQIQATCTDTFDRK